MAEHPIEGMMGVTMEKIRQLVDANTIICLLYTSPSPRDCS